MNTLPFPFAEQCYFNFSLGSKKLPPIQAEVATSAAEIYQALNYRTWLDFKQPLVLVFNTPATQTPVWFGFKFDIEVIIIGNDGRVQKTYEMPKYKEGSGIVVQLFSTCEAAILVPKGFCKKWAVLEQCTFVRRTSLQSALTKKTA